MDTSLKNWITLNKINAIEISDEMFEVPTVGKFYHLKPNEEGLLFDEEFKLITNDFDDEYINLSDYIVYEFGRKFYYTDVKKKKDLLSLFKYVGEAVQDFNIPFTYLGVHGQYELLNGSREYSDWIKKAKFLGIKNLGICEKNTMAGVMKFQLECVKKDINPVLGVTLTVRTDSNSIYDIKIYIEDERGWDNLLSIYKEVNIVNTSFIYEKDLFQYSSGLTCIICPKSLEFEKLLLNKYKKAFKNFYYQIDTVEFESKEADKNYLSSLNKYLNFDIEPVLINDSYYLDVEESHIKQILNSISGKRELLSNNQYFKNLDDSFIEFQQLFSNSDKFFDLFLKAIENTNKITETCTFKVCTTERHLPKYLMNDEEKAKYGDDYEALFWDIILQNFDKKCPKGKEQEYLERLEYEFNVIKYGDVINYFLILWDVIRWCKKEGILVGHARGSAAGALISYMLEITQVDPIRWGLLFERFLNEGRVKKSLPDIDLDFPASRRDDVKKYIQNKYGYDNFAYVGTYTSLQLKGAIKELSRLENIEFQKINYLTTIIDFVDFENQSIVDLFKNACEKKQLKEFINEYSQLVNDLYLIFGSLKSMSIHACATLVTPFEKDIYHWMPIRKLLKDDETILITEGEGEIIADSGFLKNDILTIEQLDKYKYCLDLIKETIGDEIDIYNLPVDDKEVLEYFCKGFNSDIFQFGSAGLTSYLKELKPYSIHELVDATALYRPGSMDVNSHNNYILRKFGDQEITYKFGLEEITKKTNGLICYQEQVMQAFQKVGGFTLSEADDVRKAIGKKRKDLIDSYKDRFLQGAVKKGCLLEEAEDIWHDIEVHSGYSFNLSHAVSYTLISWVGQWLKVHYPIQFWTTALQFSKDEEEIARYISELKKITDIKVLPPNINFSERTFTTNFKKQEIYWAVSKIKFLGDVAVEAIIEERNKNGEFFSFKEFMSRVEKRKVNKRIIVNLILSGAFDEVENIVNKQDRIKLINEYYEISKTKEAEKIELFTSKDINKEFWWIIQQRELIGYGDINFRNMIKMFPDLITYITEYLDSNQLFDKEKENTNVVVGAILDKIIRRNSKKGEYAHIVLRSNDEVINLTIWSNELSSLGKLEDKVGKICFIRARLKYDDYRKTQSLESNDNFIMQFLD